MPTMADCTQWLRQVAVFIALTSLLPSLLSVAVGGNTQTPYNAALNRPVSVYPSDATCGGITTRELLRYSANNYVVCTAGCGRNFTIQQNANRFPTDVIQIGGEKCHMAESGNDELKSSMCWLIPAWSTPFTYSVWFKPTETRTKQ